jgi:hypothetical protein
VEVFPLSQHLVENIPLLLEGVEGLVTAEVGAVVSRRLERDRVDEGVNRGGDLEGKRERAGLNYISIHCFAIRKM